MSVSSILGSGALVGKDNTTVQPSDLDSKEVVGLYFSAHWCPPCKMFTPQLAEWYKKLKAAGKSIEIVFVSSDRDESSFNEYFGQMPWLALPFADRETKAKLSKQFKVSGIPTFVLLDGKGNLLSKSGRKIVDTDPTGADFPWTPLSLQDALGDTFVKGDTTITKADLKGKNIGLYFSAHWCGPCRAFTPQLAALYKKLEAAGKPFEIIFVSSDSDEASFNEYRSEMPWAALPFSKRKEKAALSEIFDVEGIPTFVMLESLESGTVINANARSMVGADVDGKEFPWYPKALTDMAVSVDGINESPCLIALLGGLDDDASQKTKDAVEAVAKKHTDAARAKGNSQSDILFFFAKTDEGVVGRIRQLTKAEGPTLILLD
eukprot:CAMPEP_0195543198 /NCGR_PEP_ID=MMETSP0794_2-20130614/51994_1 /TAXON_ID=515487 /ORGANISM="Stephanopyxis turris, Strain CCMP 815" /LENGTH=376 /DNA_ID=CAMNT_0040677351 /DNA_START=100 /DNA_END=1227 /DNA_ORIENTATION=-